MIQRKILDRGRGELVGKRLITIHITTILLAFLEQFLFVKNMVVDEAERKGTKAGKSVKLHNNNNHKERHEEKG